jgi:thiosulfate dehydrogenase (quinone) large subunit
MKANAEADFRVAHALARVGLGLNIALHGLVRLPHLRSFAEGLQQQFAATMLPGSMVLLTGFGIPIAEAIIGLLLLLGLFLRVALIAGLVLMFVLMAGVCLLQKWDIAGLQLNYVAYYAALLATMRWSGWSWDARRLPGPPGEPGVSPPKFPRDDSAN